tara:strand:+ start:409 stop:1239 length:831 start_codon:yes stop_codon:yes gene_type:complete
MRLNKDKFFICIALLAVSIGWLKPGYVASEKLVLTGSSTVAPLVGELARRFELVNSGVRIDVQTGGSSRGINDTRNAIADIGMVSRALKQQEKDLYAFTIALDGISIILHASNRVAELSRQQIVDIYSGKITNWKMVGGQDAHITVVNKAEGRSTLELFLNYLKLRNSEIQPHVIIGDNQQGIKTVAGNPNSIGYVSIGAAEYEVGHGVAIKLLPLDGIDASVTNVRRGIFPLSRPLNLITNSVPTGLVKDFIEFARSKQVNDLVEAQYFVSVDAN